MQGARQSYHELPLCTEKNKADLRCYIDGKLKTLVEEGGKGEGGIGEDKVKEIIVDEMARLLSNSNSDP